MTLSNKLFRIWPVIVTVALVTACSGEKSAIEYIESANSYLQSGDTRTALIEIRNAVSQDPGNKEARSLLGKLELRQGNWESAETQLLKALELGVAESSVATDISQIFLQLGKLEELQGVDITRLGETEKAQVLGYKSEAAILSNQLPKAHLLAAEALYSDATDAVALTVNARLQLLENNVPAARTYLATALEKTPGHSPAWELLGDIESGELRFTEALSAYTSAIESATEVASPLFRRAKTHLALNDLASATSDIGVFKKSGIQSPAVSLLHSEILLREGKIAEAQNTLENGMKNTPDYQPAVRSLAIIHLLRGNLGQAEQYGKQFLESTDTDDSRILLAAIRLQSDRLKQAEQTLLPLAESGRLNVLGSQVLITSMIKQNKLDEAVDNMLTLHEILTSADISESTPLALDSNPASIIGAALMSNRTTTSDDTTSEDYLTKRDLVFIEAVNALAIRDTNGALKKAVKLLEMSPDKGDIYTLIARIHVADGNVTKANEALARALELDPSSSTAVILAAMLQADASQSEAAINGLQQALRQATGPMRERLLLAMAIVKMSDGDRDAAIDYLDQARAENPASYQASVFLANYYANNSNPEGVIDSLSGLSSTGLQNYDVIELRLKAQIALKHFDEAIDLVTPVIESEPKMAIWRYLRARANAGKNDLDAVNRDLDAAFRIDPDHTPSKLAKANLSLLTHDIQQAELQLNQLKTLIPGSEALAELSSRLEFARQRDSQSEGTQVSTQPPVNTEDVMKRARAHWFNGDQKKALDAMTNWLEKRPDDIAVRLTLANTYMKMERSSDAVVAYQAVLKTDTENFMALNNLAWLLRSEDPEVAIGHATRAVKLQPDNVATLDTLAVIQLEQGMLEEAGDTFKLIRAMQPTDPTILYHGALIQSALGNKADAKIILEPIISGSFDFPDVEAARKLYEKL